MTPSCPTSAIVVGASGSIGEALVRALAERAAHVPIFALSRSGASVPQGVRTLSIDLSDEKTIAAAATRVGEAGPVGLVIVATGLLHQTGVSPEKTVRALDPTTMATVFAVNTIGPALVAKHFVPLLARRERCVFAALSARVGSIGDNRLGGWYAYRASKSALNQILRTLAIEVARSRPEAIVVGLHPGTVASSLSRPFRPDPTADGVFSPEESAAHLLRVLNGLGPDDTGGVSAWDGSSIPPERCFGPNGCPGRRHAIVRSWNRSRHAPRANIGSTLPKMISVHGDTARASVLLM